MNNGKSSNFQVNEKYKELKTDFLVKLNLPLSGWKSTFHYLLLKNRKIYMINFAFQHEIRNFIEAYSYEVEDGEEVFTRKI